MEIVKTSIVILRGCERFEFGVGRQRDGGSVSGRAAKNADGDMGRDRAISPLKSGCEVR